MMNSQSQVMLSPYAPLNRRQHHLSLSKLPTIEKPQKQQPQQRATLLPNIYIPSQQFQPQQQQQPVELPPLVRQSERKVTTFPRKEEEVISNYIRRNKKMFTTQPRVAEEPLALTPITSSKNMEQRVPSPRPQGLIQFTVRTRAGCTINRRMKTNQDSALLNPKQLSNLGFSTFTVCDGHGQYGHLVSQFLCKQTARILPTHLNKSKPDDPTELSHTLKQAYLQLNKELCESDIETSLSGSTLCSIMLWKDKIISANVGDSRAILCQEVEGGWNAVQITRDHKPDTLGERERIVNNGGRVESQRDMKGNPIGPQRVWLKSVDAPGLAMSRSFGDKVAVQAGVISEPGTLSQSLLIEVLEFQRSPHDRLLVIASDGVWEFQSNEEVMNVLKPHYEAKSIEQGAEKVIQQSVMAWKKNSLVRDDITCIVIYFY